MKTKRDSKANLDRRNFLKRGAKVLPALAAFGVAMTASGCGLVCQGDCTATCVEQCAGGCGAGCSHGCGGGCSYGCSGTCSGSCSGDCRGSCQAMER